MQIFNLSPFVSRYQKKSKLTLVEKKGHDIVFLLDVVYVKPQKIFDILLLVLLRGKVYWTA